MSSTPLDQLKQVVLEAGLEIYRTSDHEIRIAERARMHLMDSGITIFRDDATMIALTIRAQRSDFPTDTSDVLFDKIRAAMNRTLREHGFCESKAASRDITDPVDETHVLDVWHEITFHKSAADHATLIADLRWALAIPKCVTE